ncbi:Rieske 2Fe-2S domain-containing protein [Pigmentiphaga sp.]|uniref:Rieske 2Fe-2S domain-containing protein n=1 Tax=Pigmentiphaga sp. TaxID=1977564 RepID=UPI0025E28DF4|nr:Rieske 2Fe-2S domain-containing protein [Pigmentiphaga sp.]MBX6319343.1 aromatic ring-hydroxylating dioxygenase subunit alpha [Pigmentiphaga sp.]
MLKKEQNDLLTQTGPGTPLGELFRRYWLPVLLSRELPEPGCPPVRVKLLSERLLAIRDEEGNVGLIDEFCAHRGVSLWFGRYDEKGQGGGIRCPYHGWKYAADGSCLDVPSEPEESDFRHRIKLKAYPLVERGGIYWTYMGPPEFQPPLPEYEFAMVPPEHRFVSKRLQENNWLQALEGGIDSSHVSWLHRDSLKSDPLFKGAAGNQYNLKDLKPVFEVVDTDTGLLVGVRRNADDDTYYWRITPWLMPCFTMVPPRGDHPVHGHFWVPIDDENCWAWSFDYHAARPLTEAEVKAMEDGKGIHVRYVPGTFRPLQNKDNDYLMDRAAQKAGKTFSGVEGIGMQDASLQESMGPIQDRTKEHLTSTDMGIVKMRRALLKAVKALAEEGVPPPGTHPSAHHVRSAAVILPRDKPFKEAAADALKVQPGKPHASV